MTPTEISLFMQSLYSLDPDCMRYEDYRYLSFGCIPQSARHRGVWPSIEADRYYCVHPANGLICCFYCRAELTRGHYPGCRAQDYNVPFGQCPEAQHRNPITGPMQAVTRGYPCTQESAQDYDIHVSQSSEARNRNPITGSMQAASIRPNYGWPQESAQDDEIGPPARNASGSAPAIILHLPSPEDHEQLRHQCICCKKEEIKITFVPCDHSVCCFLCALKCKKCPICTSDVMANIRLR